jgi:hypothetical protein
MPLAYSPETSETSQPVLRQAPAKKLRNVACCNRVYVDEDGVISMSLRDQTVLGSVLITAYFAYIGYHGCTSGQTKCDSEHFPMISYFLKMPFYSRIFCLLSTYLCLTCIMGNIRVVYAVLYTPTKNANDGSNDTLYYFGLVGCITLPLVGYFDEDTYSLCHSILAVTFFICMSTYIFWLNSLMNKYKDQLTPAQAAIVPRLNKVTAAIIAAAVSFVTSYLVYGTAKPYFAYLEWTVTILLLNYFVIVSFDNDFYQSVKKIN